MSRTVESTNVRIRLPRPVAWAGWAASRVAPRWTAERLIDSMLRTRRRPPNDVAEAFRASGERFEVNVSGVTTRAFSHGPAGGRRVVLLHGWDGSAADFRHVVPVLVEAGFRTFTIDGPGHGESDGDRSNVVLMARAVSEVVHRTGDPVAIVAHSFGAAAVGYAMADGVPAERVVLLAPAPDPAAYVRALASFGGERLIREALAEMGRRVGVDPAAVSLRATSLSIGVPVTVVHDRADREVPLGAVEPVVADWPSAELHRTEGLGHRRLLRDPSVLAFVLRAVAGEAEGSCVHGALATRCPACGIQRDLYDRRARQA